MKAALLASIILASLLAGCAATQDHAGYALAAPRGSVVIDPGNPTTGIISGLVTDDEIRPLEGATVTLVEAGKAVLSDASGAFLFEAVPPGPWTLRAEAPLHAPTQATVHVAVDLVEEVELQLPVLASLLPHRTLHQFVGHFDCAAEYVVITGHCMLGPEAFTGQPDSTFSQDYVFALPIGENWESVVIALAWDQPANNQLEGMRLYLEREGSEAAGHAIKEGRTDGPASPVGFAVHRGQAHPRADVDPATAEPALIPDDGENAQVRVFPRGRFYDQTSQVCSDSGCFLGVGVGVDIRFEAFGTVFYNERAADGYSGIPDGH